MIGDVPHKQQTDQAVHDHPMPLFDLTPARAHLVCVPPSYGDSDRFDFVLDPIRQAVLAGIPVVYVDWSRRSQRWGDVVASTSDDPLLGTLVRREQAPTGSRRFDMLPDSGEPLGLTALRAVQRHRRDHGPCYVVLDATQPGPNCVSASETDLTVTGMDVERFALLAAEPVIHISVASAGPAAVTTARARAQRRWGIANIG